MPLHLVTPFDRTAPSEVEQPASHRVPNWRSRMADACARLAAAGIRVSLFIDPDLAQVEARTKVMALGRVKGPPAEGKRRSGL